MSSDAMITGGKEIADTRPLILLTPDLVGEARPASEREYGLRMNYADAIAEVGGLALIVPLDRGQLPAALDLAAGVVITGSAAGARVAPQRVAFERDLVAGALQLRKPLLGICHGMQLIGEYLGGRIVRDLPELEGDGTMHLPAEVPDRLAHDVTLAAGSRIAQWSDGAVARVNSLHRHVLGGTGDFRVAAHSEDGFIEAIEGASDSFCLGVQWHPEYLITAFDRRLLSAFVEACRIDAAPSGAVRNARARTIAPAEEM